ncbi:hypothetical protein HJFPF1_03859 [Paramyrothecium foliicola]|nr:hypothetical protein HJFPF1_03859 [Paramyrothecium foliicola]
MFATLHSYTQATEPVGPENMDLGDFDRTPAPSARPSIAELRDNEVAEPNSFSPEWNNNVRRHHLLKTSTSGPIIVDRTSPIPPVLSRSSLPRAPAATPSKPRSDDENRQSASSRQSLALPQTPSPVLLVEKNGAGLVAPPINRNSISAGLSMSKIDPGVLNPSQHKEAESSEGRLMWPPPKRSSKPHRKHDDHAQLKMSKWTPNLEHEEAVQRDDRAVAEPLSLRGMPSTRLQSSRSKFHQSKVAPFDPELEFMLAAQHLNTTDDAESNFSEVTQNPVSQKWRIQDNEELGITFAMPATPSYVNPHRESAVLLAQKALGQRGNEYSMSLHELETLGLQSHTNSPRTADKTKIFHSSVLTSANDQGHPKCSVEPDSPHIPGLIEAAESDMGRWPRMEAFQYVANPKTPEDHGGTVVVDSQRVDAAVPVPIARVQSQAQPRFTGFGHLKDQRSTKAFPDVSNYGAEFDTFEGPERHLQEHESIINVRAIQFTLALTDTSSRTAQPHLRSLLASDTKPFSVRHTQFILVLFIIVFETAKRCLRQPFTGISSLEPPIDSRLGPNTQDFQSWEGSYGRPLAEASLPRQASLGNGINKEFHFNNTSTLPDFSSSRNKDEFLEKPDQQPNTSQSQGHSIVTSDPFPMQAPYASMQRSPGHPGYPRIPTYECQGDQPNNEYGALLDNSPPGNFKSTQALKSRSETSRRSASSDYSSTRDRLIDDYKSAAKWLQGFFSSRNSYKCALTRLPAKVKAEVSTRQYLRRPSEPIFSNTKLGKQVNQTSQISRSNPELENHIFKRAVCDLESLFNEVLDLAAEAIDTSYSASPIDNHSTCTYHDSQNPVNISFDREQNEHRALRETNRCSESSDELFDVQPCNEGSEEEASHYACQNSLPSHREARSFGETIDPSNSTYKYGQNRGLQPQIDLTREAIHVQDRIAIQIPERHSSKAKMRHAEHTSRFNAIESKEMAQRVASMNFHSTLTDLFGASLMSRNPHQEIVDEFDARRHGGGMGVWLGIWTWCWIGSLSVGFLIGASIIDRQPPVWGFYVSIILIAVILVLNIISPEVRRSPFRRSLAEVRTGHDVSRRVARGEVMMHRVKTGPKWWGQEMYHGFRLSCEMLHQPGFAVMALYTAWIYAQIVLIIILLGSLASRFYRLRSPYVGLHVASIALGALLAIPFQKANVFSRYRKAKLESSRLTLEGKTTWSSHLVRRAIFTTLLPVAGICYTAVSSGPPLSVALPTLFAICMGFLSCLAISECNGLLMETFDTSDLLPGMTGKIRDTSGKNQKRTNYSAYPRVTAGFGVTHSLAFILASGSTALGGQISRTLGQQVTTGVVAGILLFLTTLLLLVLVRFKDVQIIPRSRSAVMDEIIEARRKSVARRASMPDDPQAILDEEKAWRPIMIGHPMGKNRRMNILELGSMTRWQEIRKQNELIDKSAHLGREALDQGLEALDDHMSEIRRDAHELLRKASGRNKTSRHSHRSTRDSDSTQDIEMENLVPGASSAPSPPASQFVERECFMGQTVAEVNEDETAGASSARRKP